MKDIVIGLMIPFLGTSLGAGMVFFLKGAISNHLEKFLLGFAAGVMIAASVWSLLMPSMEMALAAGSIEWLPSTIGFLIGVFFLLFLDRIIPHLHLNTKSPEGPSSKLSKNSMLMLAVTIHNIPEGMAVGVVFAGFLSGNTSVTVAAAYALALGIAIQNFPEGAIISMPMRGNGFSKKKSFLYGVLSGAVEPVAAVITIWLTTLITGLLPYFLSFAAGAMIYVVVEDLIPEGQSGDNTDICTIGLAFGFILMMILDVALG